ncbi:MAG: transcriptional regulator [Rhodospirillales bacterium]|nr:transcriptional regulator [Rhodospirillales bacterium]
MDDAGPTYRFAGHVLDLGKGILKDSTGEIALRPKSFGLLVHLVRNAGRVVPKDELLKTVWPDVIVTDDSLTQCISDIRRALGDKGPVLLRTVARRGYVFAEDALEPANAAQRPMPAGQRAASFERPSIAVLRFANLSGDPEQVGHGARPELFL